MEGKLFFSILLSYIAEKVLTCYVFQTLLNCSEPDRLYAIDAESVNAGVPYADTFYISTHYCITRAPKSSKASSFSAYCQIKYKKSPWGLVKSKYYFLLIL